MQQFDTLLVFLKNYFEKSQQMTTKAWKITQHAKSSGLYGPQREKTCLRGFANNKGADKPAHPRSLISAFVIRLLESTLSKLATSEFSNF